MLFRFFILNFWILNQSLMVFCSSSLDPRDFVQFVIHDFNVILKQKTWSNTLYGFKDNKGTCHYYDMREIFSEINFDNFLEKISIINELIILRYTENLKLFRHLLNSFIKLCYRDMIFNVPQFIRCSNMLQETVSASSKMFLKYLYAAVFINDTNVYILTYFKKHFKSFLNQIDLLYDLSLKEPLEIKDKTTAGAVANYIKNTFYHILDKKIIELEQLNYSVIYVNTSSVEAVIGRSIDLGKDILFKSAEEHASIFNWFYELAINDGYYKLGLNEVIVNETIGFIQIAIKKHHPRYNENQET
ncbi:uncharacterized protein LOC126898949 isoform X1 [Daktulosphaira vitifoliae]|uniref:uncharacterized protein LOC126898949 isoform X1 n=1 Tax=Daktulosphaira vitifoliae TaxID=58002 RepID=UPI0021AABFB8|nr:uncharacterized protein LOC126898949 isoform X1 [Daktulosphaira vitifoliae]